jgi:hypothetical protein
MNICINYTKEELLNTLEILKYYRPLSEPIIKLHHD